MKISENSGYRQEGREMRILIHQVGIWYFQMSLMRSTPNDLTNLLLCIYTKETKFMYTRLYVRMFIVHSCPKLKTTKYPSAIKWIYELWYFQAIINLIESKC